MKRGDLVLLAVGAAVIMVFFVLRQPKAQAQSADEAAAEKAPEHKEWTDVASDLIQTLPELVTSVGEVWDRIDGGPDPQGATG